MRKVYWWNEHSRGAVKGKRNFGDYLTDTLLTQLNVEHEWAPPEDADLVLTGSILEHLPCCWPGTVIGAGALFEDSDLHLHHTNVLAVRGPLTAKLLGKDCAIGDPGLMASTLITPQPVTWDLGVVPHWKDDDLFKRFSYGHLIDPTNGPMTVLNEIAKCRRIITSSLHGLIVSDAFGLPRQAELPPHDPHGGHLFKWEDHAAAMNMGTEFGNMVQVSQSVMESRQKEIRDALSQILP